MTEWWAALTAVEKIFIGLAFPFTVLTIIQLIMELTGFSADSSPDADIDHGGLGVEVSSNDGFMDHFQFFSVRNLIYFMMMFGWTGLALSKIHFPLFINLPLSLIAGILTTVIIGWIFYLFNKLTESGNLDLKNAVGKTGSVYLPIPAKRAGTGVIQVVVQGMTQELSAVTDGEKLETGKSIQVVELLGHNTTLVIGTGTIASN